MRSTPFRVIRKGREEPWRGTLCRFDDKNYLFTSGYVPWWNEYPGAHIPAPLEIGSARDTNMEERAKEILALTKMNWNSSDGIGSLPITLLFARRVGELMTEFGKDDKPNPSYRFLRLNSLWRFCFRPSGAATNVSIPFRPLEPTRQSAKANSSPVKS